MCAFERVPKGSAGRLAACPVRRMRFSPRPLDGRAFGRQPGDATIRASIDDGLSVASLRVHTVCSLASLLLELCGVWLRNVQHIEFLQV